MWQKVKYFYNKIPRKLRTKKVLIIATILILVFFVITRGSADKSLIETAKVQKQSIKSQVFATGKVESEADATLNFPVAGRVVWIPVKEGDYIEKGQAIASLDKEKYEIALRQAQQSVVETDAVLQQTYDSLNDDDDVESYADKVSRTAAEADKNQAYDAMKLAERNLKDTILISPISGTLISLNINVGDEILSTESVARIVDLENIVFTADIDEGDIGTIKKDQPTTIFLEAFPDEEITSNVKSVAIESKTTSTEATVIEVKFTMPEKENIILGMNGDVQITTEEKDDVLTVPIESVTEENKVWVKNNGSYSQKTVDLGIDNDSDVEIRSGIGLGEEIVVAGFDEIGKKSILDKILSR